MCGCSLVHVAIIWEDNHKKEREVDTLGCWLLLDLAISYRMAIERTDGKEIRMQTIEQALEKLKTSPFRSCFRLTEKDRAYIQEKGMDTIREHAENFIRLRLAPANLPNDGKQTPMRGHPVFIAQHATACCCRKCLHKWYHVPLGTDLTSKQQEKIVNLLMAWIVQQFSQEK